MIILLWLLSQSLNKEKLIQSSPVQIISMKSKLILNEYEQTVSSDDIVVPLMGRIQAGE